jgi:hypothetical protein
MKLIATGDIQKRILEIRQQKVMLDSDLADLYSVETKTLNRAVKRNRQRFPKDFMFQLTDIEAGLLRCQIGTSNLRGGRRHLPYVFTEQGIAMLSGVLHSQRAVKVNIEIMRAFVALRHWAVTYQQLSRKIDEMEGRYDGHFKRVFRALKQILRDEGGKKGKIGFS